MKQHANGHLSFNEYVIMYMTNWKRVVVVLLFFWVVVTYLVISPLRCDSSYDVTDKLRQVTAQLDALQRKHSRLIARMKESGNLNDIDPSFLPIDTQGPSKEYEDLRRRVYSNTKEFWYFIKYELGQLTEKEFPGTADLLKRLQDESAERKNSLLSDMEKMAALDGYQEWRLNEAANVSDLVQRRLHYLQNPPDCKEARKAVCNLNKGCGFGCQIHHLIYCLIFAYATERTLIINSKGWRYSNKGWEYMFYPISETCTSVYDDKPIMWPESVEAKVISLPYIDSMTRKPKFLPLTVPKDLAYRVMRFNGDPASWWIGQMLRYILKPRPDLQRTINETIAKLDFKKPIVGIHVRRTDKVGAEAAFHHISEYMENVRLYYDRLELQESVNVRRVYLASDDEHVLEDARKRYPRYTFVGDASIAAAAATYRRYTPRSLTGLLVDLTLLSSADYLVATFSSQVGRLAYELMQSNRMDASTSFTSLDDIYYFGGQNNHHREAVLSHQAKKSTEVSFEQGDLIGIDGNHWNGYGIGRVKKEDSNRDKLMQIGLLPWYKTNDHLVLYPFPEYPQVPQAPVPPVAPQAAT